MKRTLILSLTFLSTAIAAPTPCPTCPKSYAVSSLEEVLLPKVQENDASKVTAVKAHENQEAPTQNERVITVSNTYQATEKPSKSNVGISETSPLPPRRNEILSGAKATGVSSNDTFDSIRSNLQQQGMKASFGRR